MATSDSGVLTDFGTWGWPHWLALALTLAIGGINAWMGYSEAQPPFLLVAGSFLLGAVVFLTRFWQPVLYLLGLVHIGVLFVLWLLTGVQFPRLGLLVGGLSLALAAVVMYLFVTAETRHAKPRSR